MSIYPRTEYIMSEEDLATIVEASKSTPCMMIGNVMPSSPQENANRAWETLGKKMGFDHITVRLPRTKGPRVFTAVPSETETQRDAREQDEQRKLKQADIIRLRREISERVAQMDELKFDVFRDGDMFCATKLDFVNLQESPAGFGKTKELAITELEKELAQ